MSHLLDEKDRGPWKAEVWKREKGDVAILQSDDFHHDVSLEITGDFADFDSRMRYAEWLALRLTEACSTAQRD